MGLWAAPYPYRGVERVIRLDEAEKDLSVLFGECLGRLARWLPESRCRVLLSLGVSPVDGYRFESRQPVF